MASTPAVQTFWDQSSQPNYGTYYPSTSWPTYPTYYYTVPDKDAERLRFALELILEGGLTHEAVKQIAAKALRT